MAYGSVDQKYLIIIRLSAQAYPNSEDGGCFLHKQTNDASARICLNIKKKSFLKDRLSSTTNKDLSLYFLCP